MKISIRIVTTVERPDGTAMSLDRTVISDVGDNPHFERSETAAALREATREFIIANVLSGTRPL